MAEQEQKPFKVLAAPQGTKVCFHTGRGPVKSWTNGIVVDSDALHIRVFFRNKDPEIQTFSLTKQGYKWADTMIESSKKVRL